MFDVFIDGKPADWTDEGEFNAIVADHLRDRLPKEHPAYVSVCCTFQQY